nr:MAG TPA: hypothetical protein [Caudoviricetes sp.]
MVRSVNYYQHVVNNFIREDLHSTNDLYQHEVNLFCYLRDLYSRVKSDFDINKDDIDVLIYLDNMLNQTQKNLYYYHQLDNKKVS